jgi:hypothetical protein
MIKYTVYETVNLVNGKFYIGVHKTNNSHDDYLGSGTYITRAVAKYGKDEFVKVVLCIFDTQKEAWDKENELVEIHRNDPLCMNLRKGGSGGFDWINEQGLVDRELLARLGVNGRREVSESDPRFQERCNQAISRTLKAKGHKPLSEATKLGKKRAMVAWTGSLHTPESRHKMSEAKKERNTFSGRKWMTHAELGNRPVKKDEIDKHLAEGWVFGRKMPASSNC